MFLRGAFLFFTKILMFSNYISYKIFVLLFFSFLSVSCGTNDINTKTASTTNNNIVITSSERAVNVKEGETFRFVLKLNRASIADVSFDWSVQHISTSSSDFTSALFGSKLIRAGTTTTTISIDISDDSAYEVNEDFILNITNVTGAVPDSLAVFGSILDNDAQLVLSFEQNYSAETEGTRLTYKLQLNRANATDVSFDWSVQHVSTSAEDFTGIIAGTKRIAAGSTSTTISIDTSDDSTYEGDEIFSLNITKVTGTAPDSLAAGGRIRDNDAQSSVVLLGFEQDYSTKIEGTSLAYRLQLNRTSATDVSFDWSVQHISTSAEDFTGIIAGSKLIRAGATTTTISIDTSDDSAYEGDEIFILNITKVTGAVPDSLAVFGSILDNDTQLVLSFEQDYSAQTEGTSLTYRLQLNRANATDVSFDWSVQHISTNAEDFTGIIAGTKRIAAGSTSTTISIDTSDDSAYEGDEIFSLNIIKVTGAVPDSLVVFGSILDNDTQLVLSFEQNYSSLTEGKSLTYRLQLNRANATDVSFDWSVQHISTSAEDFTGIIADTQLIRAGDTTTTIIIETSDDSAYEANEDFILNITKLTGAVPDSLAASGRIRDNEPQPSVVLLGFEQDYISATEDVNFNYRLELNKVSATNVSFDWSVQHISTSAEDFTGIIAGTQLIRAGDITTTISIETSDDSAYEVNEDFILNITNITGAVPDSLAVFGSILDNDAQLVLSFEQNYSSVTEGTSLTYRLQLNRASATDVSFDWSVQHISTSAEDFTGLIAGTQLIRAEATTTTISIDTSDDSAYEANEDFILNITKLTGAVPDSLAVFGSILDNDAQLALSFEQNYISNTEGALLIYRLQLNRASATDVSFDWSVQHISTSSSDFTGIIAGTKRIAAGNTSTIISIDTSDDSAYEGNEIFSLNITKVTGATPDSLAASGRIRDNEPQSSVVLLGFEQDYISVTEDVNFNYRLQLNKVSATNVSFDWSVQHISTSAEDFTGIIAGTQLIRAGDTTTTISIDTSDDSAYEGNEDFILNITNITGAVPDSLAVFGSILDNDAQLVLSFEQNYSSVTEGTSLTYRLQLNRASATDVSFDWSVQHISTNAEDFTGALAGTQLIRAEATTTTISIDTSDDSAYEVNEDFILNITKLTGAVPDSLAVFGSILDNDAQLVLSFEQNYISTTEGTRLTYRLQLNRASATDVSFDWSVQHISTSAEDFTGIIAGTKRIAAGSTTVAIIIDTSDDSAYEGNEDFILNITKLTGVVPNSLAASGRIRDNEPQPSVVLLGFEQDYVSATEDVNFNYRLRLNRASAVDVSFDWSVQHISTSAEDFTGIIAGTKRIAAGSTTVDIIIDTSDDSTYEGNEIFILNITNVMGTSPSSLSVFGSILDNDAQLALSFEQDYISATEDVNFNYRLQLNKVSATNVSFDWSVQHISTSAEDFTGIIAGTQLIRAGDTTTTIIIETSDDSAYEANEDFILNITKLTGAAPDSLAVFGSILDNDAQLVLSFEQNYSSVTEGTSFIYRLQLNRASVTDVAFDWSVQHISTSSSDFTGIIAGTQLIRAGDTTTTISIDTSDDSAYEGDEDFILNITKVTGAVPSAQAVFGNILDNDTQLMLSFEQDYSIEKEGTSLTYRLQLNKASTTDVSFDWSVQHISTSSSDFTGIIAGSKLIRAGATSATIVLDTSDDSAYEGNEIFILNITKIAGTTPSSLSVFGSILDNDAQLVLSFEQNYISTTEGTSLTYRLQLNRVSATDIAFDWFVQHSSTSSSDFTGALIGTKRIAAGSTTAAIIIDTSDDSAYEGDEDFILNITKVTGAVPSALVASGRVIDNDVQPTIFFEQIARSALEGESLDYILLLTHTSTTDIIFDWSVQHISTSSSDFTGALTGTKRIAAETTATTISIDTSDDSTYEDNENFTLNITKVTGATPSRLAAGGSIINNDSQPTIFFEQVASTVLEGASISYKLRLKQASAVDVSFDWFVQHISTSASDFRGATLGGKILFARDITATIELQINDDDRPEQSEVFTLNITNIRGATPNSLSTFITILKNDLDLTVDYNGNGLIDIVTQEHFDNIRHNVAGTSYKTSADDVGVFCKGSDCRGYELLANLDLSAFANWQSIGSQNDPFTSILQGNGYSITNFTIDRGNNIGLFAALSGATIDNLVVEVASIAGDSDVGALAGNAVNSAISRIQIRAVNASSKLSATGANIGGILGRITGTTITNVTSDLSIVGGNTENADNVGGIVGYVSSSDISYATSSGSVFASGGVESVGGLVGEVHYNSTISYSSASGNVSSSGNYNNRYGGLAGYVNNNSTVSYSSASGSVTSSGDYNRAYGGLFGTVSTNSNVSYSSASGSVTSSGELSNNYGGLVGRVERNTQVSYSNASGSVTSSGQVNKNYGGLVGFSIGEVRHSWSSSSVFASNPAGLVSNNTGNLKFSYALGFASYGLVNTNTGTITNSYLNSETSGAPLARVIGSVTNIGFSDTAGMLASTGSANARIFKDFADATDEHNRKIWTFASGNYPVIRQLGVDSQAVSLAYGLLRLASPYVSDNTLNSFLGGTLNNKDIELIANSYNVNGTLAILDVNLLQSNSAICAAGSTDTIMTTTGANGATIALQKIAGSIEIEKSPSNSCEIIFSNQKTDGTLQLAAIISKGAASLTKKFEITLNAIQSIITLQPTTLITSEGDKLVFTLELNHRASRALSFDWYIQHNSTSTSDFTGARSGFEEISAGDTTATIELQINDDRRPERAEDFNLHITNIRGVTHNNLSASITILENDLDVTPDYDGNGFIDLVTQEHFDNIRHNLAGTSYKTSISDAGKTCGGNICRGYELLANLDLSTFANWQPIGSQHNPFTSILQGNGYSITNLAIDGGDYLGLFSALSGATIDNLVVEVASITGDNDVGALAGMAENSAISRVQIRAVDASSTLSATGANIGGMLGAITGTTITNVTSDLSIVGGNTENADNVGGIVGYVSSSTISYATSSGSVSASGGADNVGGLVGQAQYNSKISYSSSSGNVSSSGNYNEYYGGLVGNLMNSALSYSSASGNVSSNGTNNLYYGGLSGASDRSIRHSWSSGSVFAVNLTASLVSLNKGYVDFSYAIGAALYGLVGFNIDGMITNSYWNIETSGALAAATTHLSMSANIASSDTAGMLASTGSANARIFKGFFDATDELGDNIWSFANGSYPVITKLGIDEQAVALAYGLLRLAHPTITSGVSSFLGGTLHNEAIALDVVDYSAASTLAILDVNLLKSSSATCSVGSVGSGGSIITTTGANQAVVTLSITAATNNLHTLIFDTDCSINFNGAAVLQAGDRLQLVATITKGSASLSKKFVINFR